MECPLAVQWLCSGCVAKQHVPMQYSSLQGLVPFGAAQPRDKLELDTYLVQHLFFGWAVGSAV